MTALREHWDEANARVLQRKAQLDAMLGDSQRYESRRRDADAWLTRMEARLAGMPPPGHTADVLEMQLREQKVLSLLLHTLANHSFKRGLFILRKSFNSYSSPTPVVLLDRSYDDDVLKRRIYKKLIILRFIIVIIYVCM